MIPSLYRKDGVTKIGDLTNCIECFVEEERNGIFEVSLVYPTTDAMFNNLEEENIIMCNANDTLLNQKFRIYMTRKLMSNRIEVLARHISFDLAHDTVNSIEITNQSCEYALNTIFRQSQFSTHYRGYSDIITAQDYKISMCNCIEAIAGKHGSIVDTYGTGAEILRDNTNIHVLNKRGHDNGVTIEYAKNLTGFQLEEDTTDLVTRIMPYAKTKSKSGEEIIIMGDAVDSPLINNYAHPYISYIDYSDKFEEEEVPNKTKLTTLAKLEYERNKVDISKQNYKIEFIPLSKCVGYEGLEDKISICDIVTIKDARYGIDTKAKVIRTVFDVLKNRYDSMELGEPRTTLGDVIGGPGSSEGQVGPPGPPGPPGADGNIGDFPNTLPSTPVLSYQLYGFANIELSWTFDNKIYYQYELYASKTKNFTPNVFDIIHAGQSSSFLFQAKPNETWYFRVCGVNSHGNRTKFSDQVTVKTVKIDDLSNYVDSMAIDDALIGTLSLDRGWVGQLKGSHIDARQLTVTDGNGKRTLDIDTFGNVTLDVTSLKISSKGVATEQYTNNIVNDRIDNLEIGGRNYIKGGKGDNRNGFFYNFDIVENGYGQHTLISRNTYSRVDIAPGFILGCRDYKVGQQVTISYEIMYIDWNFPNGTDRAEFWLGQKYAGGTSASDWGAWTNVTSHELPSVGQNGCELNQWFKVQETMTIPEQAHWSIGNLSLIQLYNSNPHISASITFRIRNVKVEYGQKATDYSPAPEDTQDQIDKNKVEIIRTKDRMSDIATDLESITSKVGSVETNQTWVNGELEAIQKWKKEAEEKITDESIINTVSTEFYSKSKSDDRYGSKSDVQSLQSWKKEAEVKITDSEIINTVSSKFYNKDKIDRQYSTLTQIVDNFKFELTNSNILNEVRNSSFANKFEFWSKSADNSFLELWTGNNFKNNACACLKIPVDSEYGKLCVLKSQTMQCDASTYYSIGGRFASEMYPYGQSSDNNIENLKVAFYDSNWYYLGSYTLFEREVSTWEVITGGFTTPWNASYMNIERGGIMGGWGIPGGSTLNILTDYVFIKKGGNLTWSPHSTEVYNNITYIDDNGIKVQHEQGSYSRFSSKEMFQANQRGERTIAIRHGGLRTYNYGNYDSLFMGGLSSGVTATGNFNGNTLFGSGHCDYISLGFSESGEDNQHKGIASWIMLVHQDGTLNYGQGVYIHKPLHIQNYSYFYPRPKMYSGISFPYKDRDDLNDEISYITSSSENSKGNRKLYLSGADGIQFIVQNGGYYIGHQILEDYSSAHLHHEVWGNWDFHGWNIQNANIVRSLSNPSANLSSKERKFTRESEAIMSTCRLIQDRGEDFTMDGQCIVEIPDDIKYNIGRYDVSIIKYGRGDIWVSERNYDYFVVESDNDIKFTWVLEGELLEKATKTTANNNLYTFEEEQEEVSENAIMCIPSSEYAIMDDKQIERAVYIDNLKENNELWKLYQV